MSEPFHPPNAEATINRSRAVPVRRESKGGALAAESLPLRVATLAAT